MRDFAQIVQAFLDIAQPLQPAEPLYWSVISCRHSIERDSITLYRDEKLPGNALAQLAVRLGIAIALPALPALPAWQPTAASIAALKRFQETCSDSEGFDLPKETMDQIAAIGLICRDRGNKYCVTDFGHSVLEQSTSSPEFLELGKLGNILDDWMLVPLIPTPEMISAARSAPMCAISSDCITDDYVELYKAMIAAAKNPQSVPHETPTIPSPSKRQWHELNDEDRQQVFESLPDMLDGFLRKWGWLHFAKGIEKKCREKNA